MLYYFRQSTYHHNQQTSYQLCQFFNFSDFNRLGHIGNPFQALDLSKNPRVKELNISETDITQLDILNLQIESLRASHSRLTNLFCDRASLKNLYDLRIERTPFENNHKSLSDLVDILPDRSEADPFGRVIQGTLYTYSKEINNYASYLLSWNWVINP